MVSASHPKIGKICSPRFLCSLPLVASDLVVHQVLDKVVQDTVQRGYLELQAVSFDRTAIVEAQFEISRVQDPVKPREIIHMISTMLLDPATRYNNPVSR